MKSPLLLDPVAKEPHVGSQDESSEGPLCGSPPLSIRSPLAKAKVDAPGDFEELGQ